jgi:hypothetical protein
MKTVEDTLAVMLIDLADCAAFDGPTEQRGPVLSQ